MLAFFASLLLAPSQQDEPLPPTPFDRVVELEITADDPVLIEGKGPTVAVEHEVEFEGTLHVWTRSEQDLFLQVEDANKWKTLGSDENSGGGTTPYLALDVRAGDRLLVLIGAEPGAAGPLTLHLMAAPETEVTRASVAKGQRAFRETQKLVADGDRAKAWELIHETITELIDTPGAGSSEAISTTLFALTPLAFDELRDFNASHAASSLIRCHRERTLPEDHRDLLAARLNLANTMHALGDLGGARTLQEAVVTGFKRTLPENHRDLLIARGNLAYAMREQGDLAGARTLQEAVVAGYERTLPEDHSDLLAARLNLAASMHDLGDPTGARALLEAVLAGYERTVPEDHPDLLRARLNLANTTYGLGDLAGARSLLEAVVGGYERTVPEDHPDLLRARGNLSYMLMIQGDLAGARTLQEAVVAGYERTLPEDHSDLLVARLNLAQSMHKQGDPTGARALFEAVLAGFERTLPNYHPNLLLARHDLAVSMSEQGDLAGARALVPRQIAGMRERVLRSLAFAPRQAREAVGVEALRLAQMLFLTRSADPKLQQPCFELQETMRMVTGETARALNRAQDPAIRRLLNEAGSVREGLGDLIASLRDERDSAEFSAELTRFLQERDRLEREASRLLTERGVVTEPIDVMRLSQALREDDALVGFRRIAHWDQEDVNGPVEVGRDHLLAHVLESDGTLVRIDLGEATELERLVATWRAVLGAPLLRRIAVEAGDAKRREMAAGEALRARLLDPILAVLGKGTRRLYVCADDLVYLVPLDALPLGGERVGDRWSIANEVSFARLQVPWDANDAEPGLLVLGGVDYDVGEVAEATVAATSPRSALPDAFPRLLETGIEAERTGALFEDVLGAEPVVLTRKETTKAALFEHAPGKRYVHLATHGWFAPEGIKSTMDEEPGSRGWARMGVQERVTGMVPMLLCGLALAGANQPMNSLGRRPGILTAEELCTLDLSSCELAVLSACETNVGIRRAGQGIQSLQSALYAAGARSSITSLWKVNDTATRRLMEHFYTNLWVKRMGKADALWQAKLAMRRARHPVCDWAGWVLTGDPE